MEERDRKADEKERTDPRFSIETRRAVVTLDDSISLYLSARSRALDSRSDTESSHMDDLKVRRSNLMRALTGAIVELMKERF